MLSLFECITRFLSLALKETKLIDIVNWIFHVSKFLRSFMISFKCDLILLRSNIIQLINTPLLFNPI